jgi:hypothetical protein
VVPTTAAAAGTWQGGTRILTGFNAGEVAILHVRVWDSATGADYANAAIRGQSITFTYSVPPTGALPSALYMENFRSFAVNLIPEPSAIGLSAVAAGALLMMFRRRSRLDL